MARTTREFKGKEYPDKSKKKPKDRKWFGWPEDSYARLGGRNGKKRSYGHFSSMGSPRTGSNYKVMKNKPIDDNE